MKKKIFELIKDTYLNRMIKIFISILFIFFIVLVFKWNSLPPEIPLFYSLPRSELQLGSPVDLLILPFLSILFFTINFILASTIEYKNKIAIYLLITTGTIASFLFLTTFLKIILLIT